MKNSNLKEIEKWVKTSLKRKISVNESTIISYVMKGLVGIFLMLSIEIGAFGWSITSVDGKGYVKGKSGEKDSVAIGENAKAITAEGNNSSVAIGKNTNASGWGAAIAEGANAKQSGVAIGYSAGAKEVGGVAIGREAIVSAKQATAIGYKAKAGGLYSTAISYNSSATGSASTAIGYKATANGLYSTALSAFSNVTGERGVAIGVLSNASGYRAIAIGSGTANGNKDPNDSNAAIANKKDSVALGTGTTASIQDGIALGSFSKTTRNKEEIGYDSYSTNHPKQTRDETSPIWKATHAAVSIGDDTTGSLKTRQITGLAAGTNDTDAVNVAQLRRIITRYVSINSDENSQAENYKNDGAKGENSIAIGREALVDTGGNQGVAIGNKVQANASQSTAIGNDVKALGEASIAIGGDDTKGYDDSSLDAKVFNEVNNNNISLNGNGNNSYTTTYSKGRASTAIGVRALTLGQGSSAFGVKAQAVKNDSLALGSKSIAFGERTVAIGHEATADNEGAFAAAGYAKAKGVKSIALGYYAGTGKQDSSGVAYSHITDGEGDGNYAIAIGHHATVTGNNSIYIGSREGHTNSAVTGENSISLGTKNSIKSNNSIVIGSNININVDKEDVIAMGREVIISGGNTVSIGSESKANVNAISLGKSANSGVNAVAVGINSNSTDWGVSVGSGAQAKADSVAIGNDAKVTSNDSVTIGGHTKANGIGAIAIGAADNKIRSNADGANTIAIGGGQATGNSAIAIGKATANVAGGIALGEGAVASVDLGQTGYDVLLNKSVGTGSAWVSTKAALAIGTTDNTRQITGLAAGTNDTDAVNVAQLKKAKVTISNNGVENKKTLKDSEGNIDFIDSDNIKAVVTNKNEVKYDLKPSVTLKSKGDANSTGVHIEYSENSGENYSKLNGDTLEISRGENNGVINKVKFGIDSSNKGYLSGLEDRSPIKAENHTYNNNYSSSINGERGRAATEGAVADVANALGWEIANGTAKVGDVAKLEDGVVTKKQVAFKGTDDTKVSVENKDNGYEVQVGISDTLKSKINGIDVTNKANKDGTNITNIKKWREKIEVYSKTEVDGKSITFNGDEGSKKVNLDGSLGIKGTKDDKKFGTVTTVTNGDVIVDLTTETKTALKEASHTKTELDSLKDNTLTFGAKVGTDFARKNSENKKVSIVEGDITENSENYKGDNLKTKIETENNNATIKIGLKENLSGINSISSSKNEILLSEEGNIKLSGVNDATVKLTGLSNGKISTDSTDAVTGKQLYELQEKAIKFGGNSTGNEDYVSRKLGEKLTIKGEGILNGNTATNNIKVDVDKDKESLTIKLAESLVGIKSITNEGNTITINNDGTTVNKPIYIGDKEENNQVVTKKEISSLGKIKYKAEGENEKEVVLTTGFDFKGDENITPAANDKGVITHILKKDLNINSISKKDGAKITLGTDDITLSQGTNPITLKGIAKGKADGDAVSYEQLKSISDSLGGKSTIGNDGSVTAPTYTLYAGNKDNKENLYSTVENALTAIDEVSNTNKDEIKTLKENSMTFNASRNTSKLTRKNSETKEITITEGEVTDSSISYKGTNLKTEIVADGDNKAKVNIGLREDLEGIKSIKGTNNKIVLDDTNGNIKLSKGTSQENKDINVKLTGVADGTTDYDAVNFSQLKTKVDKSTYESGMGEINNKIALKLSIEDAKNDYVSSENKLIIKDNDGSEKAILYKTPKSMLQIAGKEGKNIITNLDEDRLEISVIDSPTFTGANIAGVNFTTKKVKGADGKETKEIEIHAGGAKITNVTGGDYDKEENKGSRAVVNAGQLWEVNEKAKKAQSDATAAITKADAAQERADSAHNIATTNKINIEKGLDFIADSGNEINRKLGEKLKISGDTNNISTKTDKDSSAIVVSLTESPIFGNIKINQNGDGKITGLSKGAKDEDAVNVSQLGPLASALNITIGNDGSVTAPTYTLGDNKYETVGDAITNIYNQTIKPITFEDGENNRDDVKLGGNIKFKEDVKDKNIAIRLEPSNHTYEFSIKKDPEFKGTVKALDGFDANSKKIINVAAGESDTDAVNYKQLKELKSGLTSSVQLSLQSPFTYTVNGEKVIKFGDNFYKPTDIDSNGKPKENAEPITDGVIISAINKDASVTTPSKLTNIADGEISNGSKDAVNGSQLYAVKQNVADITTNIKNSKNEILKGDFSYVVATDSEGNKLVKAKGNYYKVEDVEVDENGDLKAKEGIAGVDLSKVKLSAVNPNGTITKNPTVLSNIAKGISDTDAVNVGQLKASGWKLAVNDEIDTKKVAMDDTVRYKSGNKNLAISKDSEDKTHNITFTISDTPKFGEVSINDGERGVIKGLKNTTWNGTATSGQAATEDQLKVAIEGINTQIGANATNAVKYDIKDEAVDKTKVTLEGTGGTTITNLKAGTISDTSKDAINGSQLHNEVLKLKRDLLGETNDINKPFEVELTDYNGHPTTYSDVNTALKSLNNGFRIAGSGESTGGIDAVAGATNVHPNQTMAIIGEKDGNIKTKVSKETITVKDFEKEGNIELTIPTVTIKLSKDPKFDTVTAKNSITIGDSSSSDNPIIKINENNKGTINGLINKTFNPKSITSGQAATEDQLVIVTEDVNKKVDELEDSIPYEYTSDGTNSLVKGKDGKFYIKDELKNAKYDKTKNKYTKEDGTDLSGVEKANVYVKTKDDAKKLTNVKSSLDGLDEIANKYIGTDDKAKNEGITLAQAVLTDENKGLLHQKEDKLLNSVATLRDVQTLAIAGLDFTANKAEESKDNVVHRELGTSIAIEGENPVDGTTYTTKNITTTSDKEKNKIIIKLAENPEFKGITLKGEKGEDGKAGKDGKIVVDKDGNVSVINGIDGKDGKTPKKVITEDTVGNAEISYTANKEKNKKKISLNSGFDFTNGDNISAVVENEGVVKFNLNKELTNIDSIEKGDKKTKITLGDNDITLSQESNKSVKIKGVAKGTDTGEAVNVDQLKDIVTALGGKSEITSDGNWIKPTYKLKAGATSGTETKNYDNVGAALDALDSAIKVNNDTIKESVMFFQGNDGAEKKVEIKLGETLKITGEEEVSNVSKTATNNITVVKNSTNDGLEVKLAKDLVNIDTVTTTTSTDGKKEKTTLSQKGIKAESNDSTADLTANGLKVNSKDTSKTDVTKLTIDGVELADKESDATVKNKVSKSSVSLTDNRDGKKDSNISTAKATTITDKDSNKTEVKAGNIFVGGGTDNLLIDKKSITTNKSKIEFFDENITLSKVTKDADKSIKLSGIKSGKISIDSKEAINGSQLNNLATTILGATVTDNNTVKAPEFTKLKDNKGKDDTKDDITYASAINNIADRLNEGIKYKAELDKNNYTKTTTTTNYLGSTLEIIKAKNNGISIGSENDKKTYVGDNLITKISQTEGNSTIEIGFNEKPKFKEITIKDNEKSLSILPEKIDFVKDEENGTGIITGLKDLDNESTGDTAVNKRYVDTIKNDIDKNINNVIINVDGVESSVPYEYTSDGTNSLVKGKDDNFYTKDELKGATYDNNKKKYVKNDSEIAPSITKDKVYIKTKGTDARKLTNVASALDGEGDKIKKIRNLKEDKSNSKEILNSVATIKDLQTVVNAGLKFRGNTYENNKEIFKTLGDVVVIKGEGTDYIDANGANKPTKNKFESASGNIQVDLSQNEMIIKLSKRLDNLESAKFSKEVTKKDGVKAKVKSVIDGEGTIITEYNANNNPTGKSAEYKLEGINLDDKKDKASLTSKDLTFTSKDDDKDKTSTVVNKYGVIVKGKDDKEDIVIKVGDDNKAPTIILKDDKGNESIKITAGDSSDQNNNKAPSIDFAKDGKNGTGIITGLKDIDDKETDGSIAVNKNYVDNIKKGISTDINNINIKLDNLDANTPYEYTDGTDTLVKGKDGKFYKASDIDGATYDKSNNKYIKEGEDLKTGIDEEKILVRTKGTIKELANVKSSLEVGDKVSKYNSKDEQGKIKEADRKEAITLAKETSEKLLDLSDTKDLNKVVTVRDLQVVAVAGLDFVGNKFDDSKDTHKALGEKLIIKGEGTDKPESGNYKFESANGNIRVDSAGNGLTVKLNKELKNITSISNGKTTITLVDDTVVINNPLYVGSKDDKNQVVTKKDLKINVTGNNGSGSVNLGDTLNIKGGDNITTEAINGGIKIDLTQDTKDKINSITKGEAGIVVYTDKFGNQVVKIDDKYYDKNDIYEGKPLFKDKDGNKYVKKDDGKFYKYDGLNVDNNSIELSEPIETNVKIDEIKASVVNPKSETNVPTKLSNIDKGEISKTSTDAVNGSQLWEVENKIKTSGAQNFTITSDEKDKSITVDSSKNNFAIKGDKNIETSVENNEVKIKLKDELTNIKSISGNKNLNNQKTTIKLGDGEITLSNTKSNGDKVGNVVLKGIENGEISETSTEAVNGGQLYQTNKAVIDNSNRISNLEDSTSRGIAGAMAQAGVKFQEMGVNQAVVAGAVSNYKGRYGVAVGIQGAPTENTRVHTIISATPGRSKDMNTGITVGGSYKFNLK